MELTDNKFNSLTVFMASFLLCYVRGSMVVFFRPSVYLGTGESEKKLNLA